ncbi:hypothetical protein E0493_19760 [Roseomonas sp. M0104]|uniref:Uncharacterized protein n=1 Tax=Teichococcus coralli TaxID=2545983 RepID=A0A845BFF9_9PROT|nr:hypothetical protein [Pseudoroseomonas coralli]MXP65588.1 hypothetical protein [Pseudoroseomonas coralli]
MSGAAAAPPRPRRRRALASGLRLALAQETVADSAALEEQLRGIAASQGAPLPPEADLPEMLARLEPGGGLPPELPAVLAILLLPLLRLEPVLPRMRPDSLPRMRPDSQPRMRPEPPLRSAPR